MGLFHIQNILYFNSILWPHYTIVLNVFDFTFCHARSLWPVQITIHKRHKTVATIDISFSSIVQNVTSIISLTLYHSLPYSKRNRKQFWFHLSTYRTFFIYSKISNELQTKSSLHPQYKTLPFSLLQGCMTGQKETK